MEFLRGYKPWALLLLILVIALPPRHPYVAQKINAYAIRSAEQKFGTKSLAPEHEAMIRAIAHRIGAPENIIIRKMNYTALATFGYYNAFVFFPSFLNYITIGDTPFLFVSEGFFEGLSVEEQQFVIGHEMVHARERHTQYLNLTVLIFKFILLFMVYSIRRRVMLSNVYHADSKNRKIILNSLTLLASFFVLFFCNQIELAYRRHIEWVADGESLKALKSHEGCLKLLDRWEQEFKMAPHNSYWGLLMSHPSLHERRTYCLKLQNGLKDLL
jgi:Zn-dependent protease with chaperone function